MLRVVRSCAGAAAVAVALLVTGCSQTGRPAERVGPATRPVAMAAPATMPSASLAGLRVSGPYASGNLLVWLVHGPDRTNGRAYLTLAEAMEQKKLVVHETGDVNQLAVENVSDEVVYIPAGSVVKGGRQDRTLGTDVIITRADGRMPIDAFCVEHGRWQQRGGEAAGYFASNSAMVAGKNMKLAANTNAAGFADQGAVWNEVATAQRQLAQRVERTELAMRAAPAGGTPAEAQPVQQLQQMAVAQRPSNADAGPVAGSLQLRAGDVAQPALAVTGGASPSSFQLTMESEGVKVLTERHKNALLNAPAGEADVVGYVYAVNGELSGGNVYASPKLFTKLWPMLLDSAIVEAVADESAPPATQPVARPKPIPSADAALKLLAEGAAPSQNRDVNPRTRVATYDQADNVLMICEDKANAGVPVARSVIVKPQGEAAQRLQPRPQRLNLQDNVNPNEPMQLQQVQPAPNAPAQR
jgi:hypothetical protein